MPVSEAAELREQRASAFEELKKLIDKAEQESRDFTAEEAQEYDRIEGDIDQLEKRFARIEKMNDLEKRLTVSDVIADEQEQRTDGEQDVPKSLKEFMEQRGKGTLPQDQPEYRSAFYKWITAKSDHALEADELRTLSKATAGAGANLVPIEFERTLIQLLRFFGVMRDIARVMTTQDGAVLQVPTISAHGTASWTAENAAFSPSDETFGQTSLSAYKAATIILVSEELLQDAAFDLENYIAQEFAARIGVLENTAYVAGDGVGKPTGFLTGATVGKTGATGQTTTIAGDDVFDLYHSLLVPYRRNAVWVANDALIKSLRKVKESTGQYIWQPGLTTGQPDALLGKAIYADPDMPAPAANAQSLAFGDFSYYWIRDARGVAFQRLNELYAANGQVGFRAYQRTDGKLLNSNAIRTYAHSAT